MFVDDEEHILQVTEMLLASLNIEAILVNSGKKAMEVLNKRHNTIGVMFLDLTMPQMNGLEVLEWMQNQQINVPVILQTGIENQGELDQAIQLGAKDYVVKPYTKTQLHELIMRYAIGKICPIIKQPGKSK